MLRAQLARCNLRTVDSCFFDRYVGIDCSGAKTPTSSLPGLRVYVANRNSFPSEVQPPSSLRKYWTRRGIAEWLVEHLSEARPTLVGIDHGFSFPVRFFDEYRLPHEWPAFLDDFQKHWPTDHDIYVAFVREGVCGNAAARRGNASWRRVTEQRARAKSVFHFNVRGTVANSTYAGIPWLRYTRLQTVGVHFWPFDGWVIPRGRSVIAEVYPSLWSRAFEKGKRNDHQHDAFSIAEWMRRSDVDGTLAKFFTPNLELAEKKAADAEGWILGLHDVDSFSRIKPATGLRS
jgi:hypothetical protein